MTDKQIIDGVDVSECGFFHPEYKNTDCHIALAFSEEYEGCIKCVNNPNCYYKQLKRKEQELQEAMDNYIQLDLQRVKEYNELVDLYKAKEQECERLKWYLKEIRDDELKTLDIEWDEYETHCIDTEYTNIINLVEEALEERSPEDCRYKKDK